MKKVIILFLLGSVACYFQACRKNSFKKLHFGGHFVDWRGKGKKASISVTVVDSDAHKSKAIGSRSFSSEPDGSFDISCQLAKSDSYFFIFTPEGAKKALFQQKELPSDQFFDFGKIVLPSLIVCKIKLKYTSNQDVSILFNGQENPIYSKTDTTTYVSAMMYKEDFEKTKYFNLVYRISGPNINETYNVPIPFGERDTITADINF